MSMDLLSIFRIVVILSIIYSESVVIGNVGNVRNGSKILFYSVVGTYSHHLALHPLAASLAQRGHNVTYLSSFKMKNEDSKIAYFYPQVVVDAIGVALKTIVKQEYRGQVPNGYDTFFPNAIGLCDLLYASEQVQLWMNSSSFDLLIIDACYNECALGLGHKFKIPPILFQTAAFFNWHYDVFGIPSESSWIPDLRPNLTHQMGFLERTWNTLSTLHMFLFTMSRSYYPLLTDTIRRGLGDPSVPDVLEMLREVKLMLVNSYFAAEYARSLPPFVIPIGGAYIRGPTNETLPPEIEKFIGKFEQGFMLVSFGTGFELTEKSRKDLIHVMKTNFQNIGFIVTFTGGRGEADAENILVVPWAPQELILSNPRILAFLSHCGMLSLNEAAYYGVPVLAAPGFVDQDYNAEILVALGGGIRIEIADLTRETLEWSIRQIISDESYKKRMKSISGMFRDRPQSPMETAVWWVEHVLRQVFQGNDLSLLKPLGIKQPWYQRREIDVYAFIFAIFLVSLLLVLKIGKLFCTYFKDKHARNSKSKLKNN